MSLTPAQRRALAWLDGNSPAVEFEVRRRGFKLRTFDVLVAKGLVHVEHRQGRVKRIATYWTPGRLPGTTDGGEA